MTDNIQNVAVLGAGTMGAGIAQMLALAGREVLLYDVGTGLVDRGLRGITAALRSRVDRGKLEESASESALRLISTTTDLGRAADYDLVIEAAPEDLALKRQIFATLGANSPRSILSTNTSSLAVTAIGAASPYPERTVGLHFFNPATVMPLVEVIAGARTSPETIETVVSFAREIGKTPVQSADSPGFIVNRVARPFYGEALKILGEGTASVVPIDAAVRAAGFRMGPFELMDLIGIDINFAVTKAVFEAFFGESRYRPHPIQQRMVEAGRLGQKSGVGFYDYSGGGKGDATIRGDTPFSEKRGGHFIEPELVADFCRKAGIEGSDVHPAGSEIVVRILALIMNEAALAAGEGVASVRDIDAAMRLGTNYPKGPLRWADEVGLDVLFAVLANLKDTLGEERYRCAPLLWHLVMTGAVGDGSGGGFHTPGEKGMV